MRTAIDSSVLLAIFNDEPGAAAWLDLLIRARREGRLIVCDVVYAELTGAFPTEADLGAALAKMGIDFDPVSPAAAWWAGQRFCEYRREGGPRVHLVPDFLIAAHARIQADRLAAVDRGYVRRYFSDLTLAAP